MAKSNSSKNNASKANRDNHANQLNPNSAANKAARDNKANQMNPNNIANKAAGSNKVNSMFSVTPIKLLPENRVNLAEPTKLQRIKF